MTDFFIKKETKNKKAKGLTLPLEGVNMRPKLKKHKSLIEINKLVLIENDIKSKAILKQFDRLFRKLVSIICDIDENSASSSDCAIALNEISKLTSMLEKKYQKDLKRIQYEKLNKKLLLLEKQVREKLLIIRTNEMLEKMIRAPELQEERGRGR